VNTSSNAYIDRLMQHLQARVDASEYRVLAPFAEALWTRTLEEDLASRDAGDDAGATIEAWRHLALRTGSEINIHLSNPVVARDGWQSSHSVVVVSAPDMPFMVDSMLMALSHDGIVTHQLNNVVVGVDRDSSGQISGLSSALDHTNRELLIYAEIDRLEDQALPQLSGRLRQTATELQAVVEDFTPMKAKVRTIIEQLRDAPPPLDEAEIEEAIAFLEWLLVNHFTFLGCREFVYPDGMIRQTDEVFGVHRVRPPASERRMQDQPPRTQGFLQSPTLLSFSKSGTKSRVHRPAYPDYVGVKQFDAQGRVTGEVGLSGLYTSRVYMEFPERIPVVRRKVENVLEASGLDLAGFDGKVFAQVLATYPRDELFQISEAELSENAMVITDIHERRRVRVFHRYDPYGLFVTTLVYMPRDLFSTDIRLKLFDLLVATFDAEDADHDILLSESILVRVQFTLRVGPGSQIDIDRIDLEKQISEMIGDWKSELNEALITQLGEAHGRRLIRTYGDGFSAGYREHFTARAAVSDIETVEALSEEQELSTQLYRLPEDKPSTLRLKIYHLGATLPLSDIVPKLENLGLTVVSEHPYSILREGATPVPVHDYQLHFPQGLDLQSAAPHFNDAFVHIWHGQVEDDGFNRLILHAALSWRQVSVLRIYAQYMKQIRFGFSQRFISATLNDHATIAKALVEYFEALFDPSQSTQAAAHRSSIRSRITVALDAINLLNEDRILRRFLELIDATRRTNYYVMDEQDHPRAYISLKLVPGQISGMPLPRPEHEIFISAPYFEGVHLRSGPVARGGIRWSDRLEDFRTEVLGLVKAQRVKNAVIVPTGAKGGFVRKGEVSGEDCYRDFIRGLLDVTDNIVDGTIRTPANVKALDQQDPYLVVAADKGTAAFSDIANAIAEDYQFWLGDGFASGGSFGYDHKKMGITARGAWVSVQRHFAERQIDVQQTPISVLGIGDMSGDVFGNGMLLSQCIKLVAAFNHQHIFIDPDPDPSPSHAERTRLFNLPESTWADYDTSLLSGGGGIFPRSLKSISLSEQARERFNIEAQELTPDELIHHLLKSPVQLIWNGGVGTYVKASSESHDEVGDRANDHLRADARDLRCTVFGEGGNLGLTQRARIEFSLAGGAVNSDFIDNSAGVDCSDHEVNIKIALNEAVTREDLTRKQRNTLLAEMTDEVAQLVLANNYNQAQTLSLAARQAAHHPAEYQRLIAFLVQHTDLDAALEFLPSEEELTERYAAASGLTGPELAVLLAYAKIHVKTCLIGDDTLLEPLLSKRVYQPFPSPLQSHESIDLQAHRLAPEIIATQLANEVVDRMGISFVAQMTESVGASVPSIVLAYAMVAECFDIEAWFAEVRALGALASDHQLAVLLEIGQLGRRASRWILQHGPSGLTPDQLVENFKPPLQRLILARDGAFGDKGAAWRARVDTLTLAGFPETLAQRSAAAEDLGNLLPLIDVAQQVNCDMMRLAEVNVEVGHEMSFDWLAAHMLELPVATHWQALQRESILDELHHRQLSLSAKIMQESNGQFSAWSARHPEFSTTWLGFVNEARTASQPDFSMHAIIVHKLGDLLISL